MRIPIVLLLVAFHNQVLASGSELVESNFHWYQNNYEHIHSVLAGSNMREVIPIINTVGTIWEFHDGAIRNEVSPALALAFTHHPRQMLGWFQEHPTEFEQWLEKFPYTLLTDYSGGKTAELEAVKIALISSLSAFIKSKEDPSLIKMAKNLNSKLLATQVREVD
jgi:hypothetical protein